MTEDSERMMQIKGSDGEWHDYPLAQYIQEHPEDFMPMCNGQIVGAIPFDPFTFGQPDSSGDIVMSDGTQVSIESVGDNDVLVLHSDGLGNEWWEDS